MPTLAAPGHDLYHDNTPTHRGGGIASDSVRAAATAQARGHEWVDSDVHLMHRTRAGVRLGPRDPDLVAVNAHGAPFLPRWMRKGQKFETSALEDHPTPTMAGALKRNAEHGQGTELEPKNLHPLATDHILDEMFAQLARDAEAAYGEHWQRRTVVKVLTNHTGGLDYALTVLFWAHHHGFRTMVLCRGRWRFKRIPAAAQAYVTWARGARKGLYPKR